MNNHTLKSRIGLYEKAMPATLSWEERLREAKSLGFDFVEISVDETDERQQRLDWGDDDINQLRQLCFQYDIPLQSMCLSAHRKFPFGSEHPQVREKAREIMEKAIQLAYRLGIRTIQLAGYDVYYESQSLQTHQRFVDGMRWAAKRAEQAGVMLAVEIMDTPYLNSLSKFEVLKREVPSPYFMAYPDVGNITGWNHDVCTELKLARDHLVQIHLKDTLKVKHGFPGKFRDLVIGEGEVDFPAIFTALKEIHYGAPFVIEMWAHDEHWRDNIITAKQRLTAMAQSVGFPL
ncbi:L-ribulose-5-phosphate 3-epimerase [Vibrio rhizosphaerae]|uniref:L-ribulose-5-phosphate 3-epimerase n=1 Tax=Vibrio rhizosphaerae TaxID=398736 RepID=A0ABU4IR84_9VIBR|nr:L-ribulose-5-phosphate 3-epimerase [Vibrio rhizosphaerae]MDW6091905.1 L-ribulose-5-phosphate 3-epimerase [Vibrio rhizosphaerae]